MRLQHLLDPAVAALGHAVGLEVPGRGQAMVDAEVGAEQVELVLAGGGPFAPTEQAGDGRLLNRVRSVRFIDRMQNIDCATWWIGTVKATEYSPSRGDFRRLYAPKN